MESLDAVKLSELMRRTQGNPQIKLALIDGPIVSDHPALAQAKIVQLPSTTSASVCSQSESIACRHGTLIAGMLAASRDSGAPAICPACQFLHRPIFSEATTNDMQMPSTSPNDLAVALVECIEAGANLINLSLAITQPSSKMERELEQALDLSALRGVMVVAAAGNQGTVGSTTITRHPWVIPVVACDNEGVPLAQTNLSRAIAQGGLRAPGEGITSLGTTGKSYTSSGTSVATPIVSGAAALLWSLFPSTGAERIKYALCHSSMNRRRDILPPLLDTARAYDFLR
jgi:subtilisin family serine protease